MFDIGFQELIIIFVVALIVFGPKKLPEISRTLAKWVVEIRRGVNIAKRQIEEEMKDELKMPEDIIRSLPTDDTALTDDTADKCEDLKKDDEEKT
jgi:sec-independent protein translocase protein TatB